jgi:hypothetical protein
MGRFDRGEIHGPEEIEEGVGAPTKLLVIDEGAEEGTVGAASLIHGISGKYYFPILQQVTLIDQQKLAPGYAPSATYFATGSIYKIPFFV